MNKGSRCYGIDLLRIVSIIGVCFLHVLGHGGILASANTIGRFSLVWMLEIFLVCTLIDKAKIGLFSLIKIDLLAEKIELFVKKLIAGACEKIKSLKNKA